MMQTAVAMPRSRAIHAYLLEAGYEFLRLLRTPSFALPTILFPSMFYLLFGVVLSGSVRGVDAAKYLLATYSVFGVMAPGLFGFGVVVAMEREQGLLTLKRALPMPPGAYLFAKMVMAMLFAALITLLLMAIGIVLGHVRMPLENWLALLVTDILGVLPFCAIGLLIGTLVGGQGAPAVVNLIYLPMSFLSGLWLPLRFLPKFLQQTAPLWPSTHLGRIALAMAGIGNDGRIAWHAAVLAGFALIFFLIARRRLAQTG